MSRRRAAVKRSIPLDLKYNSILLSKFINHIMKAGNKSLAQKIVYSAFDILENKYQAIPYNVFMDAINNVKPHLEVISVRVGGTNYQVPNPVDEPRAHTLAYRWIIDAARKRSEYSMIDKLASEFFEASNNRGGAIKKKEDTHKMAESNKAFVHFSPRKTQGSI